MIRKIFKTGHSLAITVSKKILAELGMGLGDTVDIEVDKDKRRLLVKPDKKKQQLALNLHLRHKLGERK